MLDGTSSSLAPKPLLHTVNQSDLMVNGHCGLVWLDQAAQYFCLAYWSTQDEAVKVVYLIAVSWS